MREDTEVAAQKSRAVLHAATKDNIKGAPLTAFATADARAHFAVRSPRRRRRRRFFGGAAPPLGALGDQRDRRLGDEDFEDFGVREMPSLASVVAMARAPDDPDDVRHDAAEALAESVVTDASYRKKARRAANDSFCFRNRRPRRALEEAARACAAGAVEPPGGETAALRFLDGFLGVYRHERRGVQTHVRPRSRVGKPERAARRRRRARLRVGGGRAPARRCR